MADRRDGGRESGAGVTGTGRERRARRRTPVGLWLVGLRHGGEINLARCRNITDRGATLVAGRSLPVASPVELRFAPDVALRATVAWSAGTETGVDFDRPIDSAGLIARLAGGPVVEAGVRVLSAAADVAPAVSRPAPAPPARAARFRDGLRVVEIAAGGAERRATLHWDGSDRPALRFEDAATGETGGRGRPSAG